MDTIQTFGNQEVTYMEFYAELLEAEYWEDMEEISEWDYPW